MTFKPLVTGEQEQEHRQWWAALFEQVSPGKAKTGVLRGFGVTATTPGASGSVVLGTGAGLCQPTTAGGVFPLVGAADETIDVFTANPMQFVNNPRYDIVGVDQVTGEATVLVGDVGAVPVDPDVPTTVLPLARLRHDANATTIPASAIDDLRDYVELLRSDEELEAGVWTDYVPVYKDATSGATLASSGAAGKWTRIGNTMFVKGSISSGATSAGGALVTLPTVATPSERDLNCGSLAIFGSTAPADQMGVALMSADLSGIIPVRQTNGYFDAPNGTALRWSVQYEVLP